MATQLDRDMAYAAGKLDGEQAFDQDKAEDMLDYARRIARVPDHLMEEWKDGFLFAVQNIDNANYTRTPSNGVDRVRAWMEGRHLIEQTSANIVVSPKTVDRIQMWLRQEPKIDTDSIINVALDCFAHYYDAWLGAEMSGDTTERIVRQRLAGAVEGKTYWDIIADTEEVHYGETS